MCNKKNSKYILKMALSVLKFAQTKFSKMSQKVQSCSKYWGKGQISKITSNHLRSFHLQAFRPVINILLTPDYFVRYKTKRYKCWRPIFPIFRRLSFWLLHKADIAETATSTFLMLFLRRFRNLPTIAYLLWSSAIDTVLCNLQKTFI